MGNHVLPNMVSALESASYVALILLSAAVPSAGCGAGSCDVTDGIYSCDGYWPSPGYQGTCDGQVLLCSNTSTPNQTTSNLLVAPVTCPPCNDASAVGAPCQTVRASQWRSVSEVTGVCMPGGLCVGCDSFVDEDSCTVGLNSSMPGCLDSSMCQWSGSKCSFSTAPGVSERGVNTRWPATKGGAPFDAWSVEAIDSHCGIAGACGSISNQDGCEKSHACSWNHSEAKCGGCRCQCDGCLSAPDTDSKRTCSSVFHNTTSECAAAKGEWCTCNAPAMSCGNALNEATCMSNAAPATATTTGACTWDATLLVDKQQGQDLGLCLECTAHSGCISGNCEGRLLNESGAYSYAYGHTSIRSQCTSCSDKSYCSGHGAAEHKGPGECTCSCDSGWTGSQCEVADCSHGAVGEHCEACASSSICHSTKWPYNQQLADPFTGRCECAASDGSASCSADGRCGARELKCGEGDIQSCGPGGKVMGDDFSKLCYCQCATGRYGTYCSETSPPVLLCDECNDSPLAQGCPCNHTWECAGTGPGGNICAGSPAVCQPFDLHARASQTFKLTVTNQNDVAVDLRLCNKSKCAGNQYKRCATVHTINTWGPASQTKTVYFSGMLPPRETVLLELPTATMYAVFVDGKCGDAAAELYPPKGGWPSELSYEVPTMCGHTPHPPNSCTFFDCGSEHHNWFENGYYGGDTVPMCPNTLRAISPTHLPLPDQTTLTDAIVPCNQSICCCANTGRHIQADTCNPLYGPY